MESLDNSQIKNTVFWVKVVGFLQHNWAVIEEVEQNKVKIFFFDDNSQVFDELDFELLDDAAIALAKNGFDTLRAKGSRDAITLWSPRLRKAITYGDEL